jgi:hypothetical protein
LTPGNSYTAGTWVYTPQVGSGPDPVADPFYNYVDPTQGIVNKYAYVVQSFVYTPNERTISVYFDTLVEQGIIKETIVQNGDSGLPLAKYNPRFSTGQYLEYRHDAASIPEYYIAANYFTPTSTNDGVMVKEGLIFPLYINTGQYGQLVSQYKSPTSALRKPVRLFTFF